MRYSRGVADTLTAATRLWKTPDTPSGGRTMPEGTTPTGMTPDGKKVTVGLENQVKMWGTPSASLANYDESPETFDQRGKDLKARGYPAQGRNLGQQAQKWPTPKALTGGANSKRAERGAGGPDLQESVGAWTTPQAHDSKGGSPDRVGRFGTKHGGRNLADDVTTWPTPARRDYKGANSPDHLDNGTGRKHMDQLPNAVAHGFSHPDPMKAALGQMSFAQRRILHQLLAVAGLFKHPRSISRPYSPPGRARPNNPARAAWRDRASYQRWAMKRHKHWSGPKLNAAFTEWLMGWPRGHALLNCSATEFYHWQRQMRGAISPATSDLHPSIWVPPTKTPKPPEQGSLF